MREPKNKGGRPAKATAETKKALIMDFYLNKADGESSIFVRRDIYSSLAEYAQSKQIDLKPYDFSRCDEAKELIKSLADRPDDSTTLACAFEAVDIDWFLRDGMPVQQRRQKLVEREDYFKRLYLKSAKALESYKTQEDTISQLKTKIVALEQELSTHADILSRNRELEKENAYYRKMIREHVTEEVAKYVATGKCSAISNLQSLVAPNGKEPAEISVQSNRTGTSVPTTTDITNIFLLKKD